MKRNPKGTLAMVNIRLISDALRFGCLDPGSVKALSSRFGNVNL
jgi:hypothetical protein